MIPVTYADAAHSTEDSSRKFDLYNILMIRRRPPDNHRLGYKSQSIGGPQLGLKEVFEAEAILGIRLFIGLLRETENLQPVKSLIADYRQQAMGDA